MIARHGSRRSETTRSHFSFLGLSFVLLLTACGGGTSQSSSGPGSSGGSVGPTGGGVSLTVTLEGDGTITSEPGTIACSNTGGVCSGSYNSGVEVLLTAAPSADYDFVGWSGAGSGCTTEPTCRTTLTSPQTVRATFRRKSYSLTVSLNGSGSIVSAPAGINCGSDCTETYAGGTSVTLTATATSGYVFSGWSGSDISCTGTGACTVAMNKARAVVASFSPVATTNYTLQVSRSGSGTVTSTPAGINCGSDCSESYASGTSVTLTATPASGYTFGGWNGGGCSGTGGCTVSMSMARSVTATFTAVTYNLTVTRSGSGSVTSSPAGISCGSDCSEGYASGTSVTLTATPASGYTFGGWSGACSGTGGCTVSMTTARNVSATFTASGPIVFQISWDAVADSRVTGYKVYYSTAPLTGGPAPTAINVGNVTTYAFDATAAGLTLGSTLYVAVTSVGSGVESDYSETVSTIVQ